MATYLQDAVTHKWREILFSTDANGLHIEYGETEYDLEPQSLPTGNEPLISISVYKQIFDIDDLPCSDICWFKAAQVVSKYVEGFTGYKFRADAIALPEGLDTVIANMIKARLEHNDGSRDLTKKSESIRNYSYTNADTATSASSLYDEELSFYAKSKIYVRGC